MGAHRPIYPSKAVVDRYLKLARDNGLKAPGFRVDPTTGAVEVFESASGEGSTGAYERWKARQDKAA